MTKERFDELVNAGVRYADGEPLNYEDFKDLDEEYFNNIIRDARDNVPSKNETDALESGENDEEHN